MTYRRQASPLHAARAAAGGAYCLALAAAALLDGHPLVLAALLAAVVVGALGAGVGRALGRAALFALPLALLVTVVNPLLTRDGLTVIARLGDLPVLGRLDVTLEATVYGAVLGLRAFVIILCFALYASAVDPDEVLRMFRRVSFRSALTATLATRMVPVLARDARRFADAQRARPGPPTGRVALVRAVAAGALDRAVDVAATLELRGYGTARRPARAARPWSRHDIAFAAAAAAVLALVVAARIAGVATFDAYPRLAAPLGLPELGLAAALVGCALLPFCDRRGIEP